MLNMEVAAIIKEISDSEIKLETTQGEKITLAKSLVPAPVLGQTIYINCSLEPTKAPRELLNELLSGNEP